MTALIAYVCFNVAPGNAALRLNEWAAQARIQILGDFQQVGSQRTAGVHGCMAVWEAMDILFAEMPGWCLHEINKGTFNVLPPDAKECQMPDIQVPKALWK